MYKAKYFDFDKLAKRELVKHEAPRVFEMKKALADHLRKEARNNLITLSNDEKEMLRIDQNRQAKGGTPLEHHPKFDSYFKDRFSRDELIRLAQDKKFNLTYKAIDIKRGVDPENAMDALKVDLSSFAQENGKEFLTDEGKKIVEDYEKELAEIAKKDVQEDVDADIKDMGLIKVEENKVAEIETEVKDSLIDAEVKVDNAVENAVADSKDFGRFVE